MCAQEKNQGILPHPDSAILIKEVTVSAYKIPGKLQTLPGSIAVISADNLRNSDAFILNDILSQIPGVTMQTGTFLTSRLVIRGMGSRTPYNTNRIRSYLNEIPLTSADGISNPEEIDISSTGKIEIIKGPSSALYGSGLGGSINMYTPVNSQKELSIRADYESFNTQKINISGNTGSKRNRLWGNIGSLSSSGYRENNHFRRASFIGTYGSEHNRWSLSSTLLFMGVWGGIPSSLGKTRFEQHPEQAAESWKAIKGYKEYFKALAGIEMSNNLTHNLKSSLMLFGKLNDNYEKRPFNNLDDISFNGGMRFRLVYQEGNAAMNAGADWISEQYKWKLDKDNLLINSNIEFRKHLNIYSVFSLKIAEVLNISAAAALNSATYRLKDRFPSDGDQSGKRSFPLVFSPRLGINYSPSEAVAFYASAGHGFSLPSPEETLLPEGNVNRDIRPEHGFQFEAGIRLNTSAVLIDAAVYWIELKDLLVTKRLTEDIFTGINAGRTRHMGVELSASSELFRSENFPGKLRADLSFTGSLNHFIDFSDNGIEYDGNYLPGIPFENASMQLNWMPWKIFSLETSFKYTGSQYLTDDNAINYPGYFLSDLSFAFRIKMKKGTDIRISAGMNNVTNTRYASMLVVNAIGIGNNEPRYYYPGLPRRIFAGISVVF